MFAPTIRLFHNHIVAGVCGGLLLFAALGAAALPQLITPQLPSGNINQPYSANLLVGSTVTLTAAGVTGLPTGLSATHNGSGSIAITGTPTVSGTFTVAVSATDTSAGTLSTSVSLTVAAATFSFASSVTNIDAGFDHSCAVVNGGVQCWGRNSNGQLGNGRLTDSAIPVIAIGAGSNVTAVSTGSNHSCAVVNGGVQCWGVNFNGQLGNNSFASSPVPVQAIAPGSNVTAIAFDDSADRLITVASDTGILAWNLDPSILIAHACTKVGRDFYKDEWAEVLPDDPMQRVCPVAGAE